MSVPQEGLELIASATFHDCALATNPRPVADAGPIVTVLRDAWLGGERVNAMLAG